MSIMISEIGNAAMVMSACILMVNHIIKTQHASEEREIITTQAYGIATCCIHIALLALFYAFITDDFGVKYVWANGHSQLPWIYKITNIWGSHEGSWLLWLAFSLMCCAKLNQEAGSLMHNHWSMTSAIVTFIIYAIWFANPFDRLFPIAPGEGMDLNPLLQDPSYLIHPPCLYIGSSTLLIPYVLALNFSRVNHEKNRALKKIIHRWALWSWGWLTVGITLGSWWAYRELGWGGAWFWDPVENAALMPWLSVTALIHASGSNDTNTDRWTIICSILAFIVNLIGIFLTRSGIILSVHSFAQDGQKGIALLMLITSAVIPVINAMIRGELPLHGNAERSSRIINQNLIMITMCLVVFSGTIYPIVFDVLTNSQISVGAGYYEYALMPFSMLLMILINQQTGVYRSLRDLVCITLMSIVMIAAVWLRVGATHHQLISTQTVLLILASNSLLAHCIVLLHKRNTMLIVHLLLSIFVGSICINRAYEDEKIIHTELDKNHKIDTMQIKVALHGSKQKSNYLMEKYRVIVKDNRSETIVYPEIRYYQARNIMKTKTAIKHYLWYDHYVTVNKLSSNQVVARVYQKPLQSLFWVCGLVMGSMAIVRSMTKKESEHVKH